MLKWTFAGVSQLETTKTRKKIGGKRRKRISSSAKAQNRKELGLGKKNGALFLPVLKSVDDPG